MKKEDLTYYKAGFLKNFTYSKEVLWRFVLLPVGLTVLSWSASTKTKVSVGPCGSVANKIGLRPSACICGLIKKISWSL